MKKHGSVLMLWAGSTFYKVLGVLALMMAAEIGYFFAARSKSYSYFDELSGSVLPLLFLAAFLGISALLTLTGAFGSKSRYTMARLRIGEDTAVIWQAVYMSACYLLLWMVQTGVILLLWYIYRQAPDSRLSDQGLFFSFYDNSFAHSLLPLSEGSRLLRNVTMCLCLGTSGACFAYGLRRGKWSIPFLLLLAAAGVLFSRPTGQLELDILLFIGFIAITVVAAYQVWGVDGCEA